MLTLALFGAIGCLGSLLVLGWYRQHDVPPEWEGILSPAGQQAYRQLRERIWAEERALDWSCDRARTAATRAEALRLLEASCDFLGGVTPGRMELLRRLALASRALGAIAPLPPIDRSRYRLAGVRRIAGLGAFLHHLLVTVEERFRLRLFVLRRGFVVVLRSVFRSKRKIEFVPSAEAAWECVLAAREDFKVLDEETLESWRVLVLAIGELRIAEAVAR